MAESKKEVKESEIFPWDDSMRPEWNGPGGVAAKAESKSHLFSPITIKGVTFKNRITVSPMYFIM
jgi:hypothetical protein